MEQKDIDRFWSKVSKGDEDDCWEWQGRLDGNGYGSFGIYSRQLLPHRVSAYLSGKLESLKKGSSAGVVIRHKCDNPACVNPRHLKVGTQKDNVRDCVSKHRNHNTSRKGFRKYQDKIPQIEALAAQGLKDWEIAKATGVPTRTVWNYLSQ